MKRILLVLLMLFCIVGCSNDKIDGEKIYKTIDSTLAKEFVEADKAILIDVGTFDEYEEYHIEGAINIPLDMLTKESIENVTNRSIDNIIVYCRDGSKSKEAAIRIIEFGYTNVYDLVGVA